MLSTQLLAVMASISAATALAITPNLQTNTFNPKSNTNMAVYWGQGPSQQRLAHFCADSNIDIIPIAFLNVFPDQVNGGYPGTNFGNQCGGETFKNKDGSDSPLLSNCPSIGPDIKTCQAMGKKILLSLGGAIPTNQSIKDDDSAKSFAKFLWNAFGPVDVTYDGPRPFGDAVVDGFDFDIESAISDNDATTQYRGYGTMIDTLRTYFAADPLKQYYISGAPQCVIPDAHLAHPIETSWFDFLFIQFYNTPQCSARAYFDANYGRQGDQPSVISFDAWVGFIRTTAMNKDVKLYIGLPAAPLPQVVYDTKMYIAPDDVYNLIDVFQCRYPKEFGGIMVFEATYSEQNLIDNKPYVDVIKGQLMDNNCAQKPTTSSSSSSTTTSSSSAASSTIASSTEATSSPTSSSSTVASASASLPPYPSSTGLWNSTYTPGPTASMGTGSSYPSSTGIWNSSSTIPVGTGSSSIPPYPTGTGIWNSTYIPGPTNPGTSGTDYQSSSVPANSSTSASSYVSTSSGEISTSSSYVTSSALYSTGASSGFSSSISSTSVPYPVNNGTSSPTTTASEGIIYTTKTITITDCPPEVTSCPVHTSVVTYPVTTSSNFPVTTSISVPLTSVPTLSPETTTSGSPSLTSSQVPVTTVPTAPGVTTTKIVTSYVTTCPVTGTTTVHGSTSVYTTSTVSTVYTTIVSTIPVVPVPTTATTPAGHGEGSHPAPVPTHGSSIPASPPSGSSNSPVSQPAPQPEQPAHGGSSNEGSTPSSGSSNSPIGSSSSSGSHPAPQPEQPAHGSSSSPSNGGSSPSSGNGNSPVGAGNSPSPAEGSSPSPSGGTGNSPIQPNNNTPSQPQGPAAPGLSTTLETSTRQITATLANNPAGSPAPGANSPGSAGTSSSAPAVITQTLVPIPLNPSQTAHGNTEAGASSTTGNSPVGATPAPVAPFPAGNGTTSAGPSGTVPVPSGSISGSAAGPSSTVVPFTGAAAGRAGMSVVALVMGAVAAVVALM